MALWYGWNRIGVFIVCKESHCNREDWLQVGRLLQKQQEGLAQLEQQANRQQEQVPLTQVVLNPPVVRGRRKGSNHGMVRLSCIAAARAVPLISILGYQEAAKAIATTSAFLAIQTL